jgi:hypothetical protein
MPVGRRNFPVGIMVIELGFNQIFRTDLEGDSD